jgi:hypothetical protein
MDYVHSYSWINFFQNFPHSHHPNVNEKEVCTGKIYNGVLYYVFC